VSAICKACGTDFEGAATLCARCSQEVTQSTTTFTPVGDVGAGNVQINLPVHDDFMLVITKGPSVGEIFTIQPEEIVLGRDVNADIFLNDMTVSREHATIAHRGDTVIIRDAGSLNGTYVNGVCVDEAELHNGDEIQIGTFHLAFSRNAKG